MRTKPTSILRAVFIVFCGLTAVTAHAQDKLPRNTREGFITTSDGVRIHYYESNLRAQPRNPTLLFVPGLMTPGWIWEHQLAHFGPHYRVVAMDPRSQGQSSKPADGHYPAARARDIKSVVDPTEVETGGAGGLHLSRHRSGFLRGSIRYRNAGRTGPGEGIAGREYDEATLSGLLAFSNAFQLDRQKATDRFVRGLYKKPQSEDHIRRMTQATLRMPTDSVVALIVGGVSSDNRPALAKIDKPTLIVVAMVRPWMQFYEDLQKRIRGSRMEIFQDAGHALFVDEAERFNTLLDSFLNSLPRGALARP